MCSRVHLNFDVVIFQILSLLYFLAMFDSLAAVLGVFSLAFSPFLAIMIRRLLYVPDYMVSSLNSS